MKQEQNVVKTREAWLNNGLMQYAMRGQFDIFKNFTHFLVKLCSMTFLVFLRRKFGSYSLNSWTIFWGYIFLLLVLGIEQVIAVEKNLSEGVSPEASSLFFIVLHMILFVFVAGYQVWESTKNLRREDGSHEYRLGNSYGISILWKPFARLVRPFNVLTNDPKTDAWYQCIDELFFQKWIEPAFLMLSGVFLGYLGFTAYASFLMFAGLCIFIVAEMEDARTYELRQQRWDAKILGHVMNNPEQELPRSAGIAVQVARLRNEDKAFDQWQASQSDHFESSSSNMTSATVSA